MFNLLVIFVLVQLATLARYLVYDAFDPLLYASTFIILIAAVALYFVGKSFRKKEMQYVPKDIPNWSFLHCQTVFTNEKPLYKGDVKRGTIQRKFLKRWHYLIAEIFGNSFLLALTIKMDDNQFEIIPNYNKFFSNQSDWVIYKNGEKMGNARTIIDLKNMAKLKEVIEFQMDGETYYTTSSTITSHIRLLHRDEKIGEMKRNYIVSNVHIMDVQDDTPEKIIPFILHAFYFKNNK